MLFSRLKLYALLGAAFLLGLVGIYAAGMQNGIARLQNETNRRRLDSIREAKEVEDEIEIMDDVDLATRARDWVRRK